MVYNFRSFQEQLRDRLLAHIAAGELTGLQLARETGFQQAHISNFLNRKRGLSLEAMDIILRAAHISLSDLLPRAKSVRRKSKIQNGDCSGFLTVPIVEEENCTATQVPKLSARDTLKIASSMVQRLPSHMHTPRPHWERFVAMRVKAADVVAMAPRLHRGAIIVIDRHHNSLTPGKSEQNMYLIRMAGTFQVRYVEASGNELLLRPHNPELPLQPLVAESGHDPLSLIIGRICVVHLHI